MNNKICIICNDIIKKNEKFEEYINNKNTKVLRNRKYSGVWKHIKCINGNSTTQKYYDSLTVCYVQKKKYLIDEKNNIIFHYRVKNNFKRERVSSKIIKEIELYKNNLKKKKILKNLESSDINLVKKELNNLKIYIKQNIIDNSSNCKDNFMYNLSETLLGLYFNNINEVKDIFYDIFNKQIDDLDYHKDIIYKNPYKYLKKLEKTPIFESIRNLFFNKDDKFLDKKINDIENIYRNQIVNILRKRYSINTIFNNTVLVNNIKDKIPGRQYYVTVIILSECNCKYSNQKHYIQERNIFYYDYSTYLSHKLTNDHTINLILENQIECTEDIIKENDKCPLCYTEYTVGQKLIKLSCNHLFCNDEECLKQWFKIKKICPYCNHIL